MYFVTDKPGLLNLLANTVLFAAGRTGSPELQAVQLEVEDGSVWATATDRISVGQARETVAESGGGGSWLIAADDVRQVITAVKGADKSAVIRVTSTKNSDQLHFEVGDRILSVDVTGETIRPRVQGLFPEQADGTRDTWKLALRQENLLKVSKIRDYREKSLPLAVQMSPGDNPRSPIMFTSGAGFRGLVMPVVMPKTGEDDHEAAFDGDWAKLSRS